MTYAAAMLQEILGGEIWQSLRSNFVATPSLSSPGEVASLVCRLELDRNWYEVPASDIHHQLSEALRFDVQHSADPAASARRITDAIFEFVDDTTIWFVDAQTLDGTPHWYAGWHLEQWWSGEVALVGIGSEHTLALRFSPSSVPSQRLDTRAITALQHGLVRSCILPHVETGFATLPSAHSAVLTVSQYWDDEARDAVHATVLFSAERNADYRKNRTGCVALEKREAADDFIDDDDSWRVSQLWEIVVEGPDSPMADEVPDDVRWRWVAQWPDNSLAVMAFAGYCEEGANQDQYAGITGRPVYHFRRRGSGIDIEFVGELLRPNVHGMPCEYSLPRS